MSRVALPSEQCLGNTLHSHSTWLFSRISAAFHDPSCPRRLEVDLSDVFSLRCVFLEMATLLLGNTLKDLDKYHLIKPREAVQVEVDNIITGTLMESRNGSNI